MFVGAALPSASAVAGNAFSPAVQVAAADKPPKGKQKKNGIAGAANSLVTDVGSLFGGNSMGGAGKSKGKGTGKKS